MISTAGIKKPITHHAECWRIHHDCARNRLDTIRQEIIRYRNELRQYARDTKSTEVSLEVVDLTLSSLQEVLMGIEPMQ